MSLRFTGEVEMIDNSRNPTRDISSVRGIGVAVNERT